MGLGSLFGEHHAQVHSGKHEGKLSHELIAGAASYEAVKAYEAHCQKEGKPVDHATAKALLAGFAGAMVDKLIETKGLDYMDRHKAKSHAEEQVKEYYNQREF